LPTGDKRGRGKKLRLGVRAYARHRGCAHPTVLQAIKEGRIKRDPDGKIDVEVADQAWAANTNRRAAAKAPADKPPAETEASGQQRSLTAARIDHETIKAKLKELELERELGKVVDADVTRAAWFKTLRIVRDRTLGLADRLADPLALETDPAALHGMLTRELRNVLDALDHALEALAAAEELEKLDAPPEAAA